MRILITALILANSVIYAQTASLDTRIQNAYDEMGETHRKAEAKGIKGQKLSVLNVNLGLLTGKIAYVPEYETRKKHVVEELRAFAKERELDVIFLQELWFQDDFSAITDWAEKAGFVPVIGKAEWKNKVSKYGMQIFIRKQSLHEKSGATEVALTDYSRTTKLEYFGGYKRALLSASVTLANKQKVRLANAHLSATVGANEIRVIQVKESARYLEKIAKDGEMVLFGADFNVSPEFEDALPAELTQWEQNREPYVAFQEATHLVDTFKALHPKDPGYTWDKRNNSLISGGPSAIKDEPLQRTDFIWVGHLTSDAKKIVPAAVVLQSEMVFTEPTIPVGKSKVHLTDHFGVFSRLLIPNRP